jgi:hypothetical protein
MQGKLSLERRHADGMPVNGALLVTLYIDTAIGHHQLRNIQKLI